MTLKFQIKQNLLSQLGLTNSKPPFFSHVIRGLHPVYVPTTSKWEKLNSVKCCSLLVLVSLQEFKVLLLWLLSGDPSAI